MSNISFTGFLCENDIRQPNCNIQQQLKEKNDQYIRDILPIKIQDFEIRRLEWEDFVGKPNENSFWIAHCFWNICYEYQLVDENNGIPKLIQPSPRSKKNFDVVIENHQQKQQSQSIGNRASTNTSVQNNKQKSPKQPPKIPLPTPKNQQLRRNSRLMNKPKLQRAKNLSEDRSSKISTPKNSSPQQKNVRSSSNFKLSKQSSVQQRIKLEIICNFLEKSWAKPCSIYYEDLLEHETGHYLIGCLCALEFKRKIELLKFNKEDNNKEQIKSIFQNNFRVFLKIEKEYDEETQHYCNEDMQRKWNHKIKEQLLLYQMYFQN